jgi:hypothetical protein
LANDPIHIGACQRGTAVQAVDDHGQDARATLR